MARVKALLIIGMMALTITAMSLAEDPKVKDDHICSTKKVNQCPQPPNNCLQSSGTCPDTLPGVSYQSWSQAPAMWFNTCMATTSGGSCKYREAICQQRYYSEPDCEGDPVCLTSSTEQYCLLTEQ